MGKNLCYNALIRKLYLHYFQALVAITKRILLNCAKRLSPLQSIYLKFVFSVSKCRRRNIWKSPERPRSRTIFSFYCSKSAMSFSFFYLFYKQVVAECYSWRGKEVMIDRQSRFIFKTQKKSSDAAEIRDKKDQCVVIYATL